ncbi:MAG: hypothetical protein K1X35_10410 [Caulobacteraceae bacterium]|nr:hypothetical protein [Caulobacteraceae bacterium]
MFLRIGLTTFLVATAAAASSALAAKAPPPPMEPLTAAASSNPPRQADCPVVANIDFNWMRAERARQARTAPPVPTGPSFDMLDEVVVPADAARRPPPDATFVIRVRVPPGGGYAQDEKSVVWREADGTWWGWRQVEGGSPATPPPPPLDPKEYEAYAKLTWDPYPPSEGRLDPQQSARMEAAFADPCRSLEPAWAPLRYKLLKAEDGERWRDCRTPVPDSSGYWAEITENGLPPRRVSYHCLPGSLGRSLVTWAGHVELPQTPPKGRSRE